MHTYRLPVGSWRYRQLATEKAAFVGRCVPNADPIIGAILPIQMLIRHSSQSVLVGRCAPNTDPIVGANRRCAFISRPDSTVGGKLTNHSYHFQLLAGYLPGMRAPRFGGNLCCTGHTFFHTCLSFSLRCFHLRAFKTSLHIISDAYIIAFYGNMRTFTPIT